MKNILSYILISSFILLSNSYAKSNDPEWFIGVGATLTGTSSAMIPQGGGLYTESEYDSSISDGFDQISIHVGTLWDIYDGIEVSLSMLALNDSAGTKQGTLTLTEIDRIIGFQDWNIGFTNQDIDLIVPFMKIGIGMASWSDNDSTTSEDISGTVGKVGLGLLLHVGPSFWVDLSYNIREIGFLGTKASEQAPLQSANIVFKMFF